MATKLIGRKVTWEYDTLSKGKEFDRLYEVDGASKVYINFEEDETKDRVSFIHNGIEIEIVPKENIAAETERAII